jgi:hypothetical protein
MGGWGVSPGETFSRSFAPLSRDAKIRRGKQLGNYVRSLCLTSEVTKFALGQVGHQQRATTA